MSHTEQEGIQSGSRRGTGIQFGHQCSDQEIQALFRAYLPFYPIHPCLSSTAPDCRTSHVFGSQLENHKSTYLSRDPDGIPSLVTVANCGESGAGRYPLPARRCGRATSHARIHAAFSRCYSTQSSQGGGPPSRLIIDQARALRVPDLPEFFQRPESRGQIEGAGHKHHLVTSNIATCFFCFLPQD